MNTEQRINVLIERKADIVPQRKLNDLQYRGPGFPAVVSYDTAPRPHTPTTVSLLSSLLACEGEGVGEEPNHTTARKPGPL
jgi:hypothetical protein